MILTVTLNLALDVTYHVNRLRPGEVHRVRTVHRRAGGKGVNVARVARVRGHEVLVTGFVGGDTGAAVRKDLATTGLPSELITVDGRTRCTVAVVDDQRATLLNEPGPEVSAEAWSAFRRRFGELANAADVVVLSGSLPPGLAEDAYAELLRIAAAAGCRTVLDTSGTPLLAALPLGPDVLKPNTEELHHATGITEVSAAAAALRQRGAGSVIVSCGPRGIYADTPEGQWRAKPPAELTGNPTGAGDACVAALAGACGRSWPEVLIDAVALSAAAVVAPIAGDVDLATYHRLLPDIVMEEVDAAVTDR